MLARQDPEWSNPDAATRTRDQNSEEKLRLVQQESMRLRRSSSRLGSSGRPPCIFGRPRSPVPDRRMLISEGALGTRVRCNGEALRQPMRKSDEGNCRKPLPSSPTWGQQQGPTSESSKTDDHRSSRGGPNSKETVSLQNSVGHDAADKVTSQRLETGTRHRHRLVCPSRKRPSSGAARMSAQRMRVMSRHRRIVRSPQNASRLRLRRPVPRFTEGSAHARARENSTTRRAGPSENMQQPTTKSRGANVDVEDGSHGRGTSEVVRGPRDRRFPVRTSCSVTVSEQLNRSMLSKSGIRTGRDQPTPNRQKIAMRHSGDKGGTAVNSHETVYHETIGGDKPRFFTDSISARAKNAVEKENAEARKVGRRGLQLAGEGRAASRGLTSKEKFSDTRRSNAASMGSVDDARETGNRTRLPPASEDEKPTTSQDVTEGSRDDTAAAHTVLVKGDATVRRSMRSCNSPKEDRSCDLERDKGGDQGEGTAPSQDTKMISFSEYERCPSPGPISRLHGSVAGGHHGYYGVHGLGSASTPQHHDPDVSCTSWYGVGRNKPLSLQQRQLPISQAMGRCQGTDSSSPTRDTDASGAGFQETSDVHPGMSGSSKLISGADREPRTCQLAKFDSASPRALAGVDESDWCVARRCCNEHNDLNDTDTTLRRHEGGIDITRHALDSSVVHDPEKDAPKIYDGDQNQTRSTHSQEENNTVGQEEETQLGMNETKHTHISTGGGEMRFLDRKIDGFSTQDPGSAAAGGISPQRQLAHEEEGGLASTESSAVGVTSDTQGDSSTTVIPRRDVDHESEHAVDSKSKTSTRESTRGPEFDEGVVDDYDDDFDDYDDDDNDDKDDEGDNY